MSEESEEDERRERIRALKAVAPAGVDVESLLAGSLAGPASDARPPVPVWEYLDYLAERRELSLDDIVRTRFPIRLHGGETTVTSIAELTSGPGSATYRVGPAEVVRLYRLQHEFGALTWEPVDRMHVEAMPPSAYRAAVFDAWRRELDSREAE